VSSIVASLKKLILKFCLMHSLVLVTVPLLHVLVQENHLDHWAGIVTVN
jgi:hypothetical protein